jgi:hypothetical protein
MAKTVQVVVSGGLGNQMFMYAAGRALAARINARLVLEISSFQRDYAYHRTYLLDRFPIRADLRLPTPWSSLLVTAEKLVRKFPSIAARCGFIDEPRVGGLEVFESRLLSPPALPFFSLRGYWQSESYFQDVEDLVRDELTPPPPTDKVACAELRRIRESAHPVAVCIRFFSEVVDGGLPVQETLSIFRQQLALHSAGTPGCDYFVFTDSPAHLVDSRCLGVPFTLITHRTRNEDAPTDLALIAACRTFFLGYSSFHWWGAWLATAANKRVTYLRFPGRPGKGYAAKGWIVEDVRRCHGRAMD